MGILIDNRQSKPIIETARIQQKARAILSDLGSPEAELSVVIVDDAEIAALNAEYLGRSGPTNVIAFPMLEGDFSNINPGLLGDVVISAETTAKEALDAGLEVGARFDALLIHGILHLFGYDHETSEEEADRMEAKSTELLKMLSELRDSVS